jgi:hypothetical protein
VNYDYTRLNVETNTLAVEGQGNDTAMENSNMPVSSHSNNNNNNNISLRYFWDGGLLANTPLSQTYIAHIDYWRRVRKLEDNIPNLRFSIINLHPAKQQNLPTDYDGVIDRRNDIIYHDRTEFDENIAVLMSDLVTLANSLIELAKEKGAIKEELHKILKEKTKGIFFSTGKHGTYDDLVKGIVNLDFVARLERRNDTNNISNKTFDFSKTTIQQLIQSGYKETKEQLKQVPVME